MTQKRKPSKVDKARHLQRIKKSISKYPWALRITERRDKPAPVMIVKERILPEQRVDTDDLVAPRSVLKERGLLYGPPQVRCLTVIRTILTRVCDKAGIPLELQQFLQEKGSPFAAICLSMKRPGASWPFCSSFRRGLRKWTGWS